MFKKSLLMITVFLIALSCSDEGVQRKQENDLRVENGRLVFQDIESFEATLSLLDKKNNQGLREWRSQFSFNSLHETLHDYFKAEASLPQELAEFSLLPVSYTSILNRRAEVKIGDDIIWFNSGKKYRASTEKELANVKLNPSEDFEAGEYAINEIEATVEEDQGAGGRYVVFGHNSSATTYTNQSPHFTSCTDGKTRKFVDKLITVTTTWDGGYLYTVKLHIVLKVDYKNPSNDWVNSAAPRYNFWNLNWSIESVDNMGHSSMTNSSSNGSIHTDENHWILLSDDPYVKSKQQGWGLWYITMTGFIGHELFKESDGSYCHRWDNNWLP